MHGDVNHGYKSTFIRGYCPEREDSENPLQIHRNPKDHSATSLECWLAWQIISKRRPILFSFMIYDLLPNTYRYNRFLYRYIHIYIHIHPYTSTPIHMHTYMNLQSYIHAYMHRFMHTYKHTCMHTCIHA